MADLDQLYTALRNADKAGDTAAATKLAAYIKTQQAPKIDYANTPAVNQIPGMAKSQDSTVNVGRDDSSILDKLKGAGEVALTAASGAVAAPVGAAAGLYRGVTGGKYGTAQGANEADKRAGEVMQNLTYQPRTEKGREYAKNVGDVANNLAGVPIPAANDLAQAASLAKPWMGTAARSAAGTAADGVRSITPNFASRLSPEMQALNTKARAYGITLQPHHFSDNKFIRILGETLDNVPLSGARDDKNQMSFERALIGQIGGDESANRLTPKVFDRAMRKSGTTIDAITRKYDLPPSKEFVEKLVSIENDARAVETPEVAGQIKGWVDRITSKMQDGPMKGTAFRKLNSDLGSKIRGTQNGDLKTALSDLQDVLLEQFNASVTDPKDAKAYQQARVQYAKAKTLAPIVGDPKGVSPPKLLGAVRNTKANKELYARGRAGDLGELADIGQLLKDPNSSNTAERGLVYGALGSGLGGFLAPAAAIPAALTYGGANLYNRFSPALIPPKP